MNLDDLDTSGNQALRRIVAQRIREAGSIDFAEFMELALYHPRHGYYVSRDPALDYQSSPNVHPVFGAAIARQMADFWRLLDRPARFDVVEAGAGSGKLARDVLDFLARSEPDCYTCLRYVLQDRAYAVAALPRLEHDVSIASGLPGEASIEGCLLSNELLDALPFRRVRMREGRLLELRVGEAGGRFVDVEAEADQELRAYFDALGLLPGDGCDAEVNLAAADWLQRAGGCLRRGFLLTLDYGYEAASLYAPWRRRGTLLTFYRHTSGDDPYARLGRQDITASVDFTTLRRAGEQGGLTTLGLTTQHELLAALGVADALSRPPQASQLEAFYQLRRAVLELTDAAGLGRIQALFQAKDVAPAQAPLGLRGAPSD